MITLNYIDEHLTWKIISKANCNTARAAGCFPMAVKDTCYKMMVSPIVEFAAAIWSMHIRTLELNLQSVNSNLSKGKQQDSYVN